MWQIQTVQGCSLWHISLYFFSQWSITLLFAVFSESHLQLKGGENLSAEGPSLEQETVVFLWGQLKPNAWGYRSLEKKTKRA